MSDDTRNQLDPERYDFGDDDDDELAADPSFDEWLLKAAPALNAPGAVPTEPMWDAIVTARAVTGKEAPISGVLPLRRRRWLGPAAIAAALLMGVALDRLVISHAERERADLVAARPGRDVSSPPTDSQIRTELYRLAAVQTLSQAEAVLTAYRTGGDVARSDPSTRQLGSWAREVLGSTRLLIDSPAGADPRLRPLLNDIELVLVQIVRLSGAPLDSTERALIDRALRDHDLLPRIRTAVPAGATDASIASD